MRRFINIPACIYPGRKKKQWRSRSQPRVSNIKDSLSLAFVPARLLSFARATLVLPSSARSAAVSVPRCYLPQPTRLRSARVRSRISAPRPATVPSSRSSALCVRIIVATTDGRRLRGEEVERCLGVSEISLTVDEEEGKVGACGDRSGAMRKAWKNV